MATLARRRRGGARVEGVAGLRSLRDGGGDGVEIAAELGTVAKLAAALAAWVDIRT